MPAYSMGILYDGFWFLSAEYSLLVPKWERMSSCMICGGLRATFLSSYTEVDAWYHASNTYIPPVLAILRVSNRNSSVSRHLDL